MDYNASQEVRLWPFVEPRPQLFSRRKRWPLCSGKRKSAKPNTGRREIRQLVANSMQSSQLTRQPRVQRKVSKRLQSYTREKSSQDRLTELDPVTDVFRNDDGVVSLIRLQAELLSRLELLLPKTLDLLRKDGFCRCGRLRELNLG
jgi:hypothetical protein